MSDDIQRTLGQHGARLENIEEAIAKIGGNVETLVANENKREGARKAVYGIAAAVGTLSSLAVSAAIKLWPK